MPITIPSTTANSYTAAASITTPVVSGTLAGDLLILIVMVKPLTADGGNVSAEAAWTLLGSHVAGGYGSTLTDDVGNTKILVFYKKLTLADMNTRAVLTMSDHSVVGLKVWGLRTDKTDWLTPNMVTANRDIAAVASTVLTSSTSLDLITNDVVIGAFSIPTDVSTPNQFGSQSMTSTGSTFSTTTELSEYDTTTGTDLGGVVSYASVTAGSGNAVINWTMVVGGTLTNVRGPVVFVRIRDNGITKVVVTKDLDVRWNDEETTAAYIVPAATLVQMSQASQTTMVFTKPAALATDMLIVVELHVGSAASAITLPSGFVQIAMNESTLANPYRHYIWYKIATASEPANYTFSWTGSATREGAFYAFKGVDLTNIFNNTTVASMKTTSSTSSPSQTITTLATKVMVIRTGTNSTSGTGWGQTPGGGTYPPAFIYTTNFRTIASWEVPFPPSTPIARLFNTDSSGYLGGVVFALNSLTSAILVSKDLDVRWDVVETYPKSSTLVDNFDAGVDTTTKWTLSGLAAASSGMVALVYDSVGEYDAIITSKENYELLDSSVFARITPLPVHPTNQPYTVFGMDNIYFYIECISNVNYLRASRTGDTSILTVPYDPVAHSWLRFRSVGTTVYWETSQNPLIGWDFFCSSVNTKHSYMSGVLKLTAGYYTATVGTAYLDNVNVVQYGLALNLRWNVLEQAVVVPIGKDLDLRWNTLQSVAIGDTVELRWNILTPVSKTVSLPWNVKTTVGKSADLRWNSLTVLGKSLQTIWNLRSVTGKSADLRWNVTVTIGKSVSLPWNIRTVTGKSLQTIWHVRLTVGKSVQTIWNLRQAVGKPVDLRWNTIGVPGVVGNSLGLLWNTKTILNKTVALRWNTTHWVSRNPQFYWNINGLVGKTVELRWTINALAPVGPIPGQLIWIDATKITATDGQEITAGYNYGYGLEPDVVGSPAPRYTADAFNGKPAIRFKVNEGRLRGVVEGVTYDWTLFYVTRWTGPGTGRGFSMQYPPSNFMVGYHSSGKDLFYDNGTFIYGPNTAWSDWGTGPGPWRLYEADSQGGQGSQFYIDKAVIGPRISGVGGMDQKWALSGYDATGAMESLDFEVAEMLIYDWKLSDTERQEVENYLWSKWFEVPTIVPVGKVLSLRWNTEILPPVPIGKSLVTVWNDLEIVSKTVSLPWNILTPVAKTVFLPWNVKTILGKSADLRWNIRSTLGKPIDLRWGIRTPVAKSISLSWNVTTPVAKTVSFRWNVLEAVYQIGRDITYRWNTRQVSYSTLSLQWNVTTPLSKTLAIQWQVFITFAAWDYYVWNVRQLTGAELSLQWKVPWPTVVWDEIESQPQIWTELVNAGGVWSEVESVDMDWTTVYTSTGPWTEVVPSETEWR